MSAAGSSNSKGAKRKRDPSPPAADNGAQWVKANTRGLDFQIAMQSSDFEAALNVPLPMDNSRGWIVGKPNPIRLWVEMHERDGDSALADSKQIFELLMESGGSKWLNEIEIAASIGRIPSFGSTRVASSAYSLWVLIGCPECDINPRNQFSVLHYLLDVLSESWFPPVIDRIDRGLLDYVDFKTGETTFYAAARSGALSVLDRMMSFVGAVNPYHPCFIAKPITSPPSVVGRIAILRAAWDAHTQVHLPNRIALVVPSLIRELIAMIVSYAC